MTQPFFATEKFSGLKGKDVKLSDAIDGCQRILNDEFKDYPESAFYMIGTINDAVEKMKISIPASATANSDGKVQESRSPAAVQKSSVGQGAAANES